MPAIGYEEANVPLFDRLLLSIPGVHRGKMFGLPGYRLGRKTFAILYGGGVAVKLGEMEAARLSAADPGITPFEPLKGIQWREWALITRPDAAAYRDDEPILLRALEFIAT